MSFCEKLNHYIEMISCSGREIAEHAKLSPTVISRYRKGERLPLADSIHLQKLAEGLASLAKEKGLEELNQEVIYESLHQEILAGRPEKIFLNDKFDKLLEDLQINVSKMASSLHYDSSYLSKIRTGKRNPSDQEVFIKDVCGYIVRCFSDEKGKNMVASVIECMPSDLNEQETYLELLTKWMSSGMIVNQDYITGFLEKLDEFNLEEYIRTIHFDRIKVPQIPFQFPVSRHYYGLKEMRDGEIDFLKNTVLSKSMEPLILCSDMPVEDMAEDEEFAKKYMFGLAMVLKKGLHIHMIHNVERPFREMMLGLENWIPLYMTGQISPYYIRGIQNRIYSHLNFVSGAASMTGNCISGHHDMGHYYLTNNREEVAFARKNLEFLLKKANSLMEIYKVGKKENLRKFLWEEAEKHGRRRRILTSPPMFLIPEKQMKKILDRNQIPEKAQAEIMKCREEEKKRMEIILYHSLISDELPALSREEYETHPALMSLGESFVERDVSLTFEEYEECLQYAERFSAEQEHYDFSVTRTKGFRNIQITCYENQWCMVSKNKAPAIHFVIRHPKLRYALEHVSLPIRDGKPEEI